MVSAAVIVATLTTVATGLLHLAAQLHFAALIRLECRTLPRCSCVYTAQLIMHAMGDRVISPPVIGFTCDKRGDVARSIIMT